MSGTCPSDLALERHLLGRPEPALAAHAAGCAACTARLAAMRREGDEFRRAVFPATVDRVEEAAVRSPWARFRMLVPVPVLATAAVLVVAVLVFRSPPPGYLGVKGGKGIGLTLFSPGNTGARILADGAEVPGRTALRFRLRTARGCRLFLLSVDGAGAVSRLDAGGEAGLLLEAGQRDLPGGVELDGAAGPERFYAVCAPEGTRATQVEVAARKIAEGGADAVRRGGALPGLPGDALQATQLLEKQP